jgi:4-oxalmesaconate hydratase
MIGAVRGNDPDTGHRFDDTRFLLESLESLETQEMNRISFQNTLEVYPRLRERVDAGTSTATSITSQLKDK